MLAVTRQVVPSDGFRDDSLAQVNSTGTDSQTPVPAAGGLLVSADWPVRFGAIPPLADGFSTRPETAPDLLVALDRAPTVAIASRARRAGAGAQQDWQRCCGKTQLAAFFAESQWRTHSVDLLIWVDARSSASIMAGYVELARTIAGASSPGDAETVAASLLRWLGQTDKRWLVVLDDVADTSVLDGLVPSGPTGRVIITAGSTQSLVGVQDALVLELGSFSSREAMSYLVGRMSSDPDQRRGASELITDLESHPLALAQATATLASSWMTCDEYRSRFSRRSTALSTKGEPPPAPAVTWTLAIDHADELMPGGCAQTCLAVAAMLDGHGIPAELFSMPAAISYIAGRSASQSAAAQSTRAGLFSLEQAGLLAIERGSDPPTVRMSHVLQRAVRAAMPAEMLELAAAAAGAALLELWPEDDRGIRLAQILRSNAACLQRAAGGLLWQDGCHPVLIRAGRSLDHAMLLSPATDYWAELTAIGDQVFGPGHPDSMAIIERLADAYVAAGRPEEAVAWHERVSAELARAFGLEHPRALEARVSLGHVLMSAGMRDQSLSVLAAALSDSEGAHGPQHHESVHIRDEVAAGYRAAGRFGEAVKLYKQILAGRDRALGASHPDTLATRQKLAEVYLADRRMKEAFSQYKRVVADWQKAQGADHPETLRARASLASAYQRGGRMALAVLAYEEVYAGTDRSLGPEDSLTLAAAVDLARIYHAVGRRSDAARLLHDTTKRGDNALASGDPLMRLAQETLTAIEGG